VVENRQVAETLVTADNVTGLAVTVPLGKGFVIVTVAALAVFWYCIWQGFWFSAAAADPLAVGALQRT
jgi:hypothetical protein